MFSGSTSMKPSKVGRSRTDEESLIEMMATVGLDASDMAVFRDMNSTDFNMAANGVLASPYFVRFEQLSSHAFLSEYPRTKTNWSNIPHEFVLEIAGATPWGEAIAQKNWLL